VLGSDLVDHVLRAPDVNSAAIERFVGGHLIVPEVHKVMQGRPHGVAGVSHALRRDHDSCETGESRDVVCGLAERGQEGCLTGTLLRRFKKGSRGRDRDRIVDLSLRLPTGQVESAVTDADRGLNGEELSGLSPILSGSGCDVSIRDQMRLIQRIPQFGVVILQLKESFTALIEQGYCGLDTASHLALAPLPSSGWRSCACQPPSPANRRRY